MNMRDFLDKKPPEEYDFTDVNPKSEYAQKHDIDKYVLYKLSAIKNKNEWYYNGKIYY